jgi:hypothetical protein
LSPQDVFFYGLFMDQGLLEAKGARPTDIRAAAVPGYALRIGARASLVQEAGGEAHGMLMKLTQAELDELYAPPGFRDYRPETVVAVLRDGSSIKALCYNLPKPPENEERNEEYASKLRALMKRLGLPWKEMR